MTGTAHDRTRLRGRIGWIGGLTLLPILAVPQVVTQLHGGDTSLRGLAGVAVMAETTSPQAAALGITDEWLEKRLVAGLRRGGVPVLERSDALGTRREPLLTVRLQTLQVPVPERRLLAWQLSLDLHQQVASLDSAGTRIRARTWTAETSVGVTSTVMLKRSVGESLDDQAAELAEAWKRRDAEK